MKQIATFNQYHLGDQLVHLHFLRALAKQHPEIFFTHTADARHIAQLQPVVADLPNLSLSSDWSHVAPGALNAWRGTENHWYQHPLRNDFAAYHLRWFEVLANRMGLASPFTKPEDLLFDYPSLQAHGKCENAWDFLIVNSEPKSGQWSGYSAEAFQNLAGWLHFTHGKGVVTTAPTGIAEIFCTADGFPPNKAFGTMRGAPLDVTQIGFLSQICGCIIGCVTGPMWPTLNIWAQPALRIHLLDTERVDLAPNTVHANSLSLVPEILKDRGLL